MKLPQSRRISTRNTLCYTLILVLIMILTITNYNRNYYSNSKYETSEADYLSSDESFEQEDDLGWPIKFESNDCETIHLAIVCGSFNSTRDFYVLLKSILFYRTHPLQLHLFVDNISQTILAELFHTWRVSDLYFEFYNITSYENEVSWIPSQHYSHRYGLMKLVFLSVLSESPKNLTKVIMLDSDMMALGNINRIWREFQQMKDKSEEAVVGIVENQSDWYLGNSELSGNRIVWPAIGRGFNTGLMLIDLTALRSLNWRQLWRQVAETELVTHLTTALADQDIFNAVIREHSHIVYKLPCSFNLQLNDHTKLDEMCSIKDNGIDFTLIHWNSPHKLDTRNAKAAYYKSWYLTFRNWDAKLLERSVCHLDYQIGQKSDIINRFAAQQNVSNVESICQDIRPRPSERLRTFLYFIQFELDKVDKFDVTIAVHLSIDRLRVLDDLAAHWPGPISAAIYLSELETNLLLTSLQNGNNLSRRKNIGYHLVFRDHGFNYPINKLRNIALNNSNTPYVFLSDVDFLPSFNLYDYLKRIIEEMAHQNGENAEPLKRRCLVVPAFENLQYKFDFPSSKADLETQLNLGSVSMFRDQIWPRGHAPTDYTKWRVSTKPYKVNWKPEYEPFIVTSREVPRFDERFIGFGWNKVEHIMQLAAMNYEFLVLPEAFVIHQFHSASYDIIKHRESFKYRSCIKQMKRNFLIELNSSYPEFFTRISATSSPTY